MSSVLLLVTDSTDDPYSGAALHDIALGRQLQRMGTRVAMVSLAMPRDSGEDEGTQQHAVVAGLDVVRAARTDVGAIGRAIRSIEEKRSIDTVLALCALDDDELDDAVGTAQHLGFPLLVTAVPVDDSEVIKALHARGVSAFVWSRALDVPEDADRTGVTATVRVAPGVDPSLADWTGLTVRDAATGRIVGVAGATAGLGTQALEHLAARGLQVRTPADRTGAPDLLHGCETLLLLQSDIPSFHLAQLAMLRGIRVVAPEVLGWPTPDADPRVLTTYPVGDLASAISLVEAEPPARGRPMLPPRIEEEAFLLEKALEHVGRAS